MRTHHGYSPDARALLQKAVAAEPPRLDWAALAVAMLEHPEVDVAACEALFASYAQRVRAQSPSAHDALEQMTALRRVLGDEEGFRGNTTDYASPENSFLDRVLETKVGLPIALSVVYLEVARRAGIPLFGVSFPGHFLTACEARDGKLVMDPFRGGQILTETGCEDLMRQVAPQVKFNPQKMLVPASVKVIAARMLNNLKRTYLEQGHGAQALGAVDLLLVLNPDHPGELRTRANLLAALGAYRAALADVERCLELSPDAPDQQALRLTAGALRQRVDFLN